MLARVKSAVRAIRFFNKHFRLKIFAEKPYTPLENNLVFQKKKIVTTILYDDVEKPFF